MSIVYDPNLAIDDIDQLKQLEITVPYSDAKGMIKAVIYFLGQDNLKAAKDVLGVWGKLNGSLYTEVTDWLTAHYML